MNVASTTRRRTELAGRHLLTQLPEITT